MWSWSASKLKRAAPASGYSPRVAGSGGEVALLAKRCEAPLVLPFHRLKVANHILEAFLLRRVLSLVQPLFHLFAQGVDGIQRTAKLLHFGFRVQGFLPVGSESHCTDKSQLVLLKVSHMGGVCGASVSACRDRRLPVLRLICCKRAVGFSGCHRAPRQANQFWRPLMATVAWAAASVCPPGFHHFVSMIAPRSPARGLTK